jgi:DAK2 domain fusion protein YloV
MAVDTEDLSGKIIRRDRFKRLPIDGQAAKWLTRAGLSWLRTNQESVNALNVFPVPDGDTGTNMVLTMQSAYNEVLDLPERNIGKMIHAVAHGALMGARGNSGVILSQIWRGFARALDDHEVLDGPLFVQAFMEARDTAYRGVVRPVEGTILTVAKDIAVAAEEALGETDDPVEILERVVEAANHSVERTPDLLPVLKDAGVVDAGGMGLYYILEGMLRYINGLPLDTAVTTVQPLASMQLEDSLESIEPGQDYEIVMDFLPHEPLELEAFYSELEQMGTSIQVGEGDGMYRVHIHVPTENRYVPIDYAMSLGTITKVAIENLIAQMEALETSAQEGKLKLAPVDPGEIAAIAVAPGPGIARVFASLGVAGIIEGGQTMNPSTQEIIAAFENLPTDQVVILPNNKNIILAANSAADLTVKNVAVIPSRTVPQGLAAMLALTPEGDFDRVVAAMKGALDEVISGEITTAVRTAEIDGVEVQEGQFIAIVDTLSERRLVRAASSLLAAVLAFLESIELDDRELVTLFYGDNVPKHQVNQIVDQIRTTYPELEVELQNGGQPHYQFIISVE